jgi:LacI family transcriptional regulator
MTRRNQSRIPSITMRDVAKHAGVSQATVSYVINNSSGQSIPPETREKVFSAVRKLGYRPNGAARNMRTQRSNFIGFITDEIATTPFAGATIKGAQDAARSHGCILLLVNTEGVPEVENAAIESMLEHRVAGIAYATMYHRSVIPPTNLAEVPAVLLDCFSEDRSIASVVPDEVGGGRAATEILLSRGHRRIGFINDIDPIPATFGRLRGYQEALAAYGVAFDPNLVTTGRSDSHGGYDSALALMQRPDRPSALFCFNDRMAMGAYDALRKLNLSIPQDVAVIGFDNQEIIAAALHPGLSTMQLPHYEMGQWAINYLFEAALEGKPPVHMVQPCPYVERESV